SDRAEGKEVWPGAGMTVTALRWPVAANGVVYCMSGYTGEPKVVAVSLDAKGDVTDKDAVLWQHKGGTPYAPSPLLVGERLYFTQLNNALLTSLDIKTGKPLISQERLSGPNGFYSSPVAAKERIYLVGRNGTTLAIKQSD